MPLTIKQLLQDKNSKEHQPPEANNYNFTSQSACNYYCLGEANAKLGCSCEVPFLYGDFIERLAYDVKSLTCSGHQFAYMKDAASWFVLGMESVNGVCKGEDDAKFIKKNKKVFYGASFCYTDDSGYSYINIMSLIKLFHRDKQLIKFNLSRKVVTSMFNAVESGYHDAVDAKRFELI